MGISYLLLQVLPISETVDGAEGTVEGEGVSGNEGSHDNLLNMTHAKSLEVLVPEGTFTAALLYGSLYTHNYCK